MSVFFCKKSVWLFPVLFSLSQCYAEMVEEEEPASSDSKPIRFLQFNEVGLGYACCQSPTSLLQHPLSKAKYHEVTGPKPQLITAQKLIKVT